MPHLARVVLSAVALCAPFASFAQQPPAGREDADALRFHNPAALPKPNGYSHAVEATGGRTIYVSGQLPLDKDGRLVGSGDFAAQAEQVFANLKAALAAAGASFDDVVRLNMYVTDMTQLKALRAARDRHIDAQRPPASTLVEVKRFVVEGAMVEIDATAVVADPARR
ncbi:RidA family protein [Luteimonas sp. SX5]|uniref:RidA family protein n=1 Tax=Luteimonas galliterrae TaxID=2940486 RepID=A0ABT0MEV7_9GAMM|nr:RidA family protein [Luteimonas galliterrae]MCL1633407.1 RidA family protein [Luteimonas galliterrae]